MADSRRLQPDLTADDNSAGSGVDDDLGRFIGRVYLQILDGREIGDPLTRITRRIDLDRSGIECLRGIGADQIVHHISQSACSSKIRAVQVEGDGIALTERIGYFPLDGCPVGNASDGRGIDHHLGAICPFSAQTANYQTALSNRIDPPIQPLEEALQQSTATQTFRLANRGNRDINGLARLGEGRQVGVNGHRCHILDLGLDVVRHLDAKVVEHGAESLLGEGVVLLASTGQTDHQTVTNQLVGTNPFNRADVLDPGGMSHTQRQQTAEECGKTE